MTHFGQIVTLLLAFAAQPLFAQETDPARPRVRPDTSATAAQAPDAAPQAGAKAPATPPAPTTAGEIAIPEGPARGPETNLPLPRFVSLSSGRGNVRRGPSLSHRIDWVFLRRDMPLQVTAEYGHWRRVTDREGVGGWMHYAMLSGVRTVIADAEMLPLRSRPNAEATIVAQLESGVVARLGECELDWCRLTAGGYKGWAPKSLIWGVAPDEIRD
ncbi:SH3 domain-containing protein [Limimaricola sp.]|uniref:SH3 domain-containing protein n=1 Tax=Limimaricola sp. TaxID=2211665 RepID=UPI004058A2B9